MVSYSPYLMDIAATVVYSHSYQKTRRTNMAAQQGRNWEIGVFEALQAFVVAQSKAAWDNSVAVCNIPERMSCLDLVSVELWCMNKKIVLRKNNETRNNLHIEENVIYVPFAIGNVLKQRKKIKFSVILR